MPSTLRILDGGMGQLLGDRGVSTHDDLWSARALLEDPDAVLGAHAEYLAAGASIITTNTYSTVPSYLAKAGMADRYVELTELAGQLARTAAQAHEGPVVVAGGLPPLSESYRPDLVLPASVASPIYSALVAALAPYVDVWLCETMSSIAEAKLASDAATDRPLYVSFTLCEEPGQGLRSHESVTSAIEAFADRAVAGFLFNCTTGEAIEAAVAEAAPLTDADLGGYPNRFNIPEKWTLDNDLDVEMRGDFGLERYVAWAERMIDVGATIIGGCCGVGPEEIAAIAPLAGSSSPDRA